MRYDLCLIRDEQRGEERLVILSAEDGEGSPTGRAWQRGDVKQAFGFELTAFQERLLPLDEVGRAAAVFSERWAGVGGPQ